MTTDRRDSGVMERYASLLPLTPETPHLSLGEGATPLIEAPRLASWVGVDQLLLKCEGLNPTGSLKDRGMAVAVALAMQRGARTILCASTGNTSASAAAYAARAALAAVVLLPKGKVAEEKMAQAVIHGARILSLDTNFDGALDLARKLADEHGLALVNSVNPHRIEGQATAAYEICDALGDPPDVLALPVGNGGNITAYWLGFRRYQERGLSSSLPRVVGAQAAGAAPLVLERPVPEPKTVASAIRIGRPASWDSALTAVRDSQGAILAVDDDDILHAHRQIASLEGVFCEPASAASVAGLRAAVSTDRIAPSGPCVCVLTGHGLKDAKLAWPKDYEIKELPAEMEAVTRELGL